ncbi:hypothetical protein GJ744_007093 [Endocarpon pusillum]|uniref:Uncharacterized protein n=1 Tax=Endocarpon pusillum TaxID=364733 RepID=A0A8H7AL75_9EURO|nr:hypothetical protein GJ744_007093 [Endocarpon pusillum]
MKDFALLRKAAIVFPRASRKVISQNFKSSKYMESTPDDGSGEFSKSRIARSLSEIGQLTAYTTIVSSPSSPSIRSVNLLATPPSRPSSAVLLHHPSGRSTYPLHHQAGHRQQSFFTIHQVRQLTRYTTKQAIVSSPSSPSIRSVNLPPTPLSRPSSAVLLHHPSGPSTYRLHHQAGHRQQSFFTIHQVGQLTSYTTKQAIVSSPSSPSIRSVNLPSAPPSTPSSAVLLHHPSGRSTYHLHHQARHRQQSFFTIHQVGQLTTCTTKHAIVSSPSSPSIRSVNLPTTPPSTPSSAVLLHHPSGRSTYPLHHQPGHH